MSKYGISVREILRINMLFLHKPNKYGLPNGILPMANGRFSAKYCGKYLGSFDSVEDAAIAHDREKKKAIIKIAKEYKEKIPKRLYDALLSWEPF